MSFIMRMPKLSPTMEVGTIAKWHIQESSVVKPGQLLMEVATDKATVEHEALDGGIVRKILVAENEEAQINQPIAIVSAKATDDITALLQEVERAKSLATAPLAAPELAPPHEAEVSPQLVKSTASGMKTPKFQAAGVVKGYDLKKDFADLPTAVKVSPYARKVAQEKGIDLTSVKGSGPGGRIVAQDVEGLTGSGVWGIGFDSHQRPSKEPGSYELEALTPMRKTVASRLQESKTFIPHFYVSMEIDAGPLTALHSQLKSHGLKVSINDIIVRACAIALRHHPEINSGFDSVEQKIIRFQTVDIAVAVALPQGLITPIIFHADYRKLGEISTKIRALVTRANKNELEPHEYMGGSFTISNLGMFGVDQFQAIINPPQSAILAIGGAVAKPVVKDGAVQPGLVMNLTLSCDHRVIDGANAAKFLETLKQLLQAPAIVLV